ncbi:MAG: hypothetical protein J6U54_11220 [Clostridiales bacterium]|nr:hypothetical protein [Clostridiales bacterium]
MEESNEIVDLSELLKNEIAAQIIYLGELDPGTEKHSAAVTDITKLYNAYNSMLETEGRYQTGMAELEQKQKQFEKELELKLKQLEEEREARAAEKKKSFWENIWKGVDTGAKLGCAALPLWFWGRMFITGLKYEEKGTISSQMNRWIIPKVFKP